MLTRHRDLRTGRSVWQKRTVRFPAARRLNRNLKVEVLVVGGGISGALMALRLARDGRRVAVVDRRRGLGLGSTAASTALLQFELDQPLVHLARRIGRRAAVQAWRCSLDALHALHRLMLDEQLNVQVDRRPSAYLAGNVLDPAGLRAETRLRQSVGLPSGYFTRAALDHRFGLKAAAAIVSDGNLATDPRALTAAVLRAAVSYGARCYTPVEVLEVHATSRRVVALTDAGLEIEAANVVFCTGYEAPKLVPAQGHRICSTWAIATRPQEQRLWPERCLIWQAADPYLYVRTTPDGRVICGGEDEEFSSAPGRDALLARKTARLSAKLGKLIPGLDTTAEFAWTGCFGQSESGLPSIGRLPAHARCFAVMGYGGNGITFSMLASQLIGSELAGHKDAAGRLFAFR